MAHFALVNKDGVVERVNCQEEGPEGDALRIERGGRWVQTSYNTHAGVHKLGGIPLRKNYAGIGHTYDTDRDAFIAPKPYPSWVLDEDTCWWNAPTPYPMEGGPYFWDEETISWKG